MKSKLLAGTAGALIATLLPLADAAASTATSRVVGVSGLVLTLSDCNERGVGVGDTGKVFYWERVDRERARAVVARVKVFKIVGGRCLARMVSATGSPRKGHLVDWTGVSPKRSLARKAALSVKGSQLAPSPGGLGARIGTRATNAQFGFGGGGSRRVDGRMRDLLSNLRIKYKIDSDGDFKVIFRLSGGRTQLAIINSKTQRYGPFEIREVCSPALSSFTLFSRGVANVLLRHNARTKVGDWQTMRLKRKYYAVFCVKIDAMMDGRSFRTYLNAVLNTADRVERKLTGSRDQY